MRPAVIQNMLIGILGITIIIIFVLFLREKVNSRERHDKLNNSIDAMVDEANKKYQKVDNAVRVSIDFNKRQIEETNTTFTKKIELLITVLEQIRKENADLRKKLKFFTEIDEDSKSITGIGDEVEKEALIRQALQELSLGGIIDPESTEESVKTSTRDVVGGTPNVLDDEQKVAFEIMNGTNENLFITGKAGTGKSFLLEMFVRATSKKTITVAPTGIAALNVSGATIHSTFGYNNLENLGVEDLSASTIRLKSEKRQVLKEIDTLIIDEISMVRVDIFDKIDKSLRIINGNSKPFGGKQVIVFGDLFQLPPVANKQETKYLTDHYGGIFFFNSNAFCNGNFGFIELATNHRQKEDVIFFDILNRLREGEYTDSDLNRLNDRLIQNKKELRRVMTLFPTKADAERVNREELARIEAKEYIYRLRTTFNAYNNRTPNLDLIFPCTEELHLKRGALVMMVANDPEKRWVNGTIGIVHSLFEDGMKITINGTTYDVSKIEFTQKETIYEHGEISYKDILKVEQYPVVLAYAITIHKSQGMTYKSIACDISKCFAPGQAYVALSRCGSMTGLHLLTRICGVMIHPNRMVVDFYKSQSTEETVQRFL